MFQAGCETLLNNTRTQLDILYTHVNTFHGLKCTKLKRGLKMATHSAKRTRTAPNIVELGEQLESNFRQRIPNIIHV